jgi:hypothetical protein
MATIAATVTTKMRTATSRLWSRKSRNPEDAVVFGSPRCAPRPPTRSLSWLRTDIA